ncbi:MAG: peptidoglycan DD-metalloendopeptidase family protein [Candidatus Competibacterales bacterium]|nr:peptidoglycan DD-metalloendopeptidase family protein [Candidatus Competibacterales bacterium]
MILLLALLLGACTSSAPVEDRTGTRPAYHRVERGENLFRIAWRYGLDYRDIAAWNRLESPDFILAGQRLRLYPPQDGDAPKVAVRGPSLPAPPATPESSARPAPTRTVTPGLSSGEWDWPTRGAIVRRFDPDRPGGKGIQISGQPGQQVRAAASGRIVYRGSGLRGYGQLLIVKHSDSLLSAYGYLGRMLVDEGDSVRRGQIIAEMDNNGREPVLHFEIRRNGEPVNPASFLPAPA